MRRFPGKGRFGLIMALGFFILTALTGSSVLLGLASYLPGDVFNVRTVQGAHIKTLRKLTLPGHADWQVRSVFPESYPATGLTVNLFIRFTRLHQVDIALSTLSGKRHPIGRLWAGDLSQQAFFVRRSVPMNLRIKFDEKGALLLLNGDERQRADLPSEPVTGIILEGKNAGLEIYHLQVKSGEKVVYSPGWFPVNSVPLRIAAMLVWVLFGLGLIRLDTWISDKFLAGAHDRTILVLISATLFFLVSWTPPGKAAASVCLGALVLTKAAGIGFQNRLSHTPVIGRWTQIPWGLLLFAFCLSSVLAITWLQDLRWAPTAYLLILAAGYACLLLYSLSRARRISFLQASIHSISYTLPVLLCLPAALLPWVKAPSSVICVGWIFSIALMMVFLFQYRKSIPGAQVFLLLLSGLILLPTEGALGFANAKGALPQFGNLLQVNTDWVPPIPTVPRTADGHPVFQGQEMIIPKPADEIRIVFLGGSTTYGDPADSRLNFVSQVREAVREEFPAISVKVYNCGYVGYNSFQIRQQVLHDLDRAGIDLAVLYTRNNDLYPLGIYTFRELFLDENTDTLPAGAHIRNTLNRAATYRALTAVRNGLLQGMDYVPKKKILRDFSLNLEEIAEAIQSQGGQVVFVPELIHPGRTGYERRDLIFLLGETMRTTADRTGAEFLDSSRVDTVNAEPAFFSDNVHLSTSGNLAVSRLIYPRIKAFLKKKGL